MAQTDRQRWDARYRDGAYEQRAWPSAYLQQCVPLIAPTQLGVRALDIACGRGRNSLYLAQQGFAVDAVDVSSVAIAHGATRALQAGLTINWRCQRSTGWCSKLAPTRNLWSDNNVSLCRKRAVADTGGTLSTRRAFVGGGTYAVG